MGKGYFKRRYSIGDGLSLGESLVCFIGKLNVKGKVNDERLLR